MAARKLYWSDPEYLDEDPASSSYDTLTHQQYLTYRLSMLSGQLDRGATKFLASTFNVTLAERRVLAALADHGDLSFGNICRRLPLDGAQISRAAASLVARGYATRSADTADARRAIFSLTDAGRALENELTTSAQSRQRLLLGELSATERKVLYRAISKLMAFVTERSPEDRLNASVGSHLDAA